MGRLFSMWSALNRKVSLPSCDCVKRRTNKRLVKWCLTFRSCLHVSESVSTRLCEYIYLSTPATPRSPSVWVSVPMTWQVDATWRRAMRWLWSVCSNLNLIANMVTSCNLRRLCRSRHQDWTVWPIVDKNKPNNSIIILKSAKSRWLHRVERWLSRHSIYISLVINGSWIPRRNTHESTTI